MANLNLDNLTDNAYNKEIEKINFRHYSGVALAKVADSLTPILPIELCLAYGEKEGYIKRERFSLVEQGLISEYLMTNEVFKCEDEQLFPFVLKFEENQDYFIPEIRKSTSKKQNDFSEKTKRDSSVSKKQASKGDDSQFQHRPYESSSATPQQQVEKFELLYLLTTSKADRERFDSQYKENHDKDMARCDDERAKKKNTRCMEPSNNFRERASKFFSGVADFFR